MSEISFPIPNPRDQTVHGFIKWIRENGMLKYGGEIPIPLIQQWIGSDAKPPLDTFLEGFRLAVRPLGMIASTMGMNGRAIRFLTREEYADYLTSKQEARYQGTLRDAQTIAATDMQDMDPAKRSKLEATGVRLVNIALDARRMLDIEKPLNPHREPTRPLK